MYNPTMNLTTAKALRMQTSSCVAFVGSGGKSTAMFKLARELSSPVIVTTTTHLGTWQIHLADSHIIANNLDNLKQKTFDLQGVILITGEIQNERTKPIDEEALFWLHSFCRDQAIHLLIEADGSRQKPLKAWADHEPPIPEFADLVVEVVGMNGMGKPLTEEFVHRADIFSKLSGLKIGDLISAESLKKVLTHKDGGLKNIPTGARSCIILNQTDKSETQSIARMLKESLLTHFQSVVAADLKNDVIHAIYEPIAGIILAAGDASRFGEPKQVLHWKGEPFVRVVVRTAINAGLLPIVVAGAYAEKVKAAIQDLNVKIVHNDDWRSGQGSSIRKGVASIPDEYGGAIFLLADQPQVNTSVLRALVEKHAEGLYPIIAPMVIDRRANPVMFDRDTFPDLMSIEGDTGGRAIFHKHRIEYLPWHDDRLLLDVDTPEQYQKLISSEDL
jgi:molybdenum cofactor cytidylyltransferase